MIALFYDGTLRLIDLEQKQVKEEDLLDSNDNFFKIKKLFRNLYVVL